MVAFRPLWGVRMLGVVDGMVVVVASLFWAATVYKVVELRKHPAPAQRSLTLTVASLAVAATFLVPVVHVLVGRVSGVANIAEPIARTAVLVAACGGQVLLLRLTAPDGRSGVAVARRSTGVVAVVVALWVFFFLAPVEAPTLRFTSRFGAQPLVVAYLALALGYLAWALVDIRRGCRRYSREASGFLAVGLRLIGTGCLVGLAYIAVKGVALVGLAGGSPIPVEVESTVGRSLAVLAGTLVVIGSTLPATGPLGRSWVSWFTAYRAHRQLYPLWADLVSVTPGIALDPAGSRLGDALRWRDLDVRVYRRVIEIRDGRLALRPYLDAAVGEQVRSAAAAAAAGAGPREAAAASEASLLLAAVASALAHRPPEVLADGRGPVGENLADELGWLTLVARHYRRAARATDPSRLQRVAPPSVRAS